MSSVPVTAIGSALVSLQRLSPSPSRVFRPGKYRLDWFELDSTGPDDCLHCMHAVLCQSGRAHPISSINLAPIANCNKDLEQVRANLIAPILT